MSTISSKNLTNSIECSFFIISYPISFPVNIPLNKNSLAKSLEVIILELKFKILEKIVRSQEIKSSLLNLLFNFSIICYNNGIFASFSSILAAIINELIAIKFISDYLILHLEKT